MYEAEDLQLGGPIALKTIRPDLAEEHSAYLLGRVPGKHYGYLVGRAVMYWLIPPALAVFAWRKRTLWRTHES
jgi:hypothetical protein